MCFFELDGKPPVPEKAHAALMHVLTLTPFYPNASDDAAGCFVAEPLRVLEECGVNSYVVATQPVYRGRAHPGSAARPADWVHYAAIPGGIGLASAGGFLYASLVSKIRKLHRLRPVDLIHAHAALPCGHAAVLLSRELGIPCVVTVHGLDVFFTNQVGGRAGQWCQRVSQFVYRSASRVICISEKVSDRVVNGGAAVNTAVIYNGVDSEMFSPAPSQPEGRTILSVGNLIPIKGHELLLRAFARLQYDYPDLSCEIVGDGPERFRLSRLASDLGIADKVHFLGRQSRKQVAEAMRRCTVFALPSRYEGLGCVYLEAMSTEKPVVACRGQGIEEIIQQGISGWLIDPEDLEGLTDALSLLVRNAGLRRQMGDAARRAIRQNFTLRHQATQLAELYRECVA